MAECMEDQFRPNQSHEKYRFHYYQVKGWMQHTPNTSFDVSKESVDIDEVRNIKEY